MRLRSAILSSACLCAAGTASAAEWTAAPLISWTADHDTNRNLLEDTRPSSSGSLNLDTILKWSNGISSFSMQPHLGWQRFTNQTGQDADSRSVKAAGNWAAGTNSLFTLNAALARDNSLSSEIEETGTFTGSTLRTSKSAGAQWNYIDSDRHQFNVQASYADLHYRTEQMIDFFGIQFPFVSEFGYRYPSLSLTDTRVLSQRTTLDVNVYGGRLLTDSGVGDSDSYGARLGLSRLLTSRIKVYMSAGLSRRDDAQTSETGYIGRFEISRATPRGDVHAFAERSIEPSIYGYLITQTEAGLGVDQHLTPRWTGSFSMKGIWGNDDGDRTGQRHRYERADATLTWRASFDWKINAGAAYVRSQRFENDPIVNGWRVSLGALWTPMPMRMSR